MSIERALFGTLLLLVIIGAPFSIRDYWKRSYQRGWRTWPRNVEIGFKACPPQEQGRE